MKGLGWNIVLGGTWVAITGTVELWNVAVGLAVGLLVISLVGGAVGAPGYLRRSWLTVSLAAYFVRELVVSNLRLAADIVYPRVLMEPAIIAVPLDARTDTEITLLANLVTLTPGSAVIDLSPDRRTMYVHVMYPVRGDLEATRRAIKDGFERRVLEVTR